MPLTFAHPAAILPFPRKNRYIHFSAMVFGSMAPDFEYFFRGQPMGQIGHSLLGFVCLNLPLVILISFIYHHFVHQSLINHLPIFLQDTYVKKTKAPNNFNLIIFCYSALIGMFTHVVWDSFTHINGYMVLKFPIFTHVFNFYGYQIPLYKFLQHGSTLFGLSLIIGYLFFRARLQRNLNSTTIISKSKIIFWSSILLLTGLFVFLWYMLDFASIRSYGILVVRFIDAFFVSLLIISVFDKYRKHGIHKWNNNL